MKRKTLSLESVTNTKIHVLGAFRRVLERDREVKVEPDKNMDSRVYVTRDSYKFVLSCMVDSNVIQIVVVDGAKDYYQFWAPNNKAFFEFKTSRGQPQNLRKPALILLKKIQLHHVYQTMSS